MAIIPQNEYQPVGTVRVLAAQSGQPRLAPEGIRVPSAPVYNNGQSGSPHTVLQAKRWFGERYERWEHCLAVRVFDLENLTPEDKDVVKFPETDWLCINEREEGSDYCWLHPEGDTSSDGERKARARKNRALAAAEARKAKAAKRK